MLIDCEDEVLRNAFDRFDVDKNGKITKEELVQVLSSLGMDSAEKDANEMMAEADLNGDGVISFEGNKNIDIQFSAHAAFLE